MQHMAQCLSISEPVSSESFSIKTTLYKLIEAVNEEIKPDEEQWVTLIVDDILRSGRSVS
ncbi:MAG: hypothetical protein ACQ9MH_17555 [Nitrospinales bacterium]